MGAIEDIMKMAKENNCTVTTAMVVAAGISRGNLKYLVEKRTVGEICAWRIYFAGSLG